MDDVRSKLLSAAGPIFADRGFEKATVREICDTAGANLAAVNYYFGDKEQLYVETVKLARMERERQVPLPDWPSTTSAENRLRDFIATTISRMVVGERAPWQTRLMLREVIQPSKACEALAEDYFRPHFEVLLAILRELVPAETPPDIVRKHGFSVIGQCLHYRVADEVIRMLTDREELDAHFSLQQVARHIADFSLAALRTYDQVAAEISQSLADAPDDSNDPQQVN